MLTPATSGADSVEEPSAIVEGHSGSITIPGKWAGRPGTRLPGISSRRVRMVVFGHSSSGLNHLVDRAMKGVMPIHERALGL